MTTDTMRFVGIALVWAVLYLPVAGMPATCQTKSTPATESSSKVAAAKPADQSSTQTVAPCQPSATEIFQLKTACMELGEKMEKAAQSEGVIVAMYSHYLPPSNRCYVELDVTWQSDKGKKLLEDGTITLRTVKDAHTRQTIVQTWYAVREKPVQLGSIDGDQLSEEAYAVARRLITDLMKEDK